MDAQSFQSNPITSNHTRGIIWGYFKEIGSAILSNIMIDKASTDMGSIFAADFTKDQVSALDQKQTFA